MEWVQVNLYTKCLQIRVIKMYSPLNRVETELVRSLLSFKIILIRLMICQLGQTVSKDLSILADTVKDALSASKG